MGATVFQVIWNAAPHAIDNVLGLAGGGGGGLGIGMAAVAPKLEACKVRAPCFLHGRRVGAAKPLAVRYAMLAFTPGEGPASRAQLAHTLRAWLVLRAGDARCQAASGALGSIAM